MKWDVFERIEYLFPYVTYFKMAGWGEPYTNTRFPEMLSRIRRHNKSAKIGFNTNALLLNEECIINLIENGVDHITVSIDSPYKENYELLRKRGSYERLINNLKLLRELKSRYSSVCPIIDFEFVVMNQNILDMPEFVKFAATFQARSIIFTNVGARPLSAGYLRFFDYRRFLEVYERTNKYAGDLGIGLTGNAVDSFELALNSQNNDTGETSTDREIGNVNITGGTSKGTPFSDNKLHDISCLEPFQTCYVCFDGSILPCCVVGGKRYIGNVLNEEFEDIWNNDAYVNLRKGFITGRYDEGIYGGRCKT
ncbi:MAG: radical SAM protein [Deltaproteobacteria bacterium]|nr:radical SAM protein [Deltaproteobacteria bacterium]